MTIADLLFRLGDSQKYLYTIDLVNYSNVFDIPQTVLLDEVFEWAIAGVTLDMPILVIQSDSDARDKMIDMIEHCDGVDFTQTQILQMLQNGITISKILEVVQ